MNPREIAEDIVPWDGQRPREIAEDIVRRFAVDGDTAALVPNGVGDYQVEWHQDGYNVEVYVTWDYESPPQVSVEYEGPGWERVLRAALDREEPR